MVQINFGLIPFLGAATYPWGGQGGGSPSQGTSPSSGGTSGPGVGGTPAGTGGTSDAGNTNGCGSSDPAGDAGGTTLPLGPNLPGGRLPVLPPIPFG